MAQVAVLGEMRGGLEGRGAGGVEGAREILRVGVVVSIIIGAGAVIVIIGRRRGGAAFPRIEAVTIGGAVGFVIGVIDGGGVPRGVPRPGARAAGRHGELGVGG